MNNNARRFNVIGTIGNGSELRPVPRVEPTLSYHIISPVTGEELAIRYNSQDAQSVGLEVAQRLCAWAIKPILREVD